MATKADWQGIIDRLGALKYPVPCYANFQNDRLTFAGFPHADASDQTTFRRIARDAGKLVGGGFEDWIACLCKSEFGTFEWRSVRPDKGEEFIHSRWDLTDAVVATEAVARDLMWEAPSVADLPANDEPENQQTEDVTGKTSRAETRKISANSLVEPPAYLVRLAEYIKRNSTDGKPRLKLVQNWLKAQKKPEYKKRKPASYMRLLRNHRDALKLAK